MGLEKIKCVHGNTCNALRKIVSDDIKNNLGLILSILGLLVGIVGLPFVYNSISNLKVDTNNFKRDTKETLELIKKDNLDIKSKVVNLATDITRIDEKVTKNNTNFAHIMNAKPEPKEMSIILQDSNIQINERLNLELKAIDTNDKEIQGATNDATWLVIPEELGIFVKNEFTALRTGKGWIIAILNRASITKEINIYEQLP